MDFFRGRESGMDWSGCDLVEVIEGLPLLKGTSVSADQLLHEIQHGWRIETVAVKYPEVRRDQLQHVMTYALERLAWNEQTMVDWRACDLVERVPGRRSGAPTIVGTRIPPDIIVRYYLSGSTIQEIHDDYPGLSTETIRLLIEYFKSSELTAA